MNDEGRAGGTAGESETERLRNTLRRHLGLAFDDSKLDFLAEVLKRRGEAHARGIEAYLQGLEAPTPSVDEIGALAQEVTVGETYFFRHMDQFRAFAEVALADRLQARQGAREIRILSAGCATGEEAYSLAIVASEALPDPSWRVSVHALDVNPAVLERAVRGRFSQWSLRETPREEQERWFHRDGREFVLDEAVRRSVVFQLCNLVQEDGGPWMPAAYDVVFCRNVLMYMTPESARAVVGRISRSLAPGGYLFLGHAETLRGLSRDFQLRHSHGTFYYQFQGRAGDVRAAPTALGAEPSAPLPHRGDALLDPFGPSSAEHWFESIQRASGRIEALAEQSSRTRSAPAQASLQTPGRDLATALDLLRHERFAEALTLVQELPAEMLRDGDVLLLQAVLLAHGGRLEEAERACAQLLADDELHAGAHYVLALCREGAGDPRGALEHNQVAAYLDAGFAMPRLHLGLLARRGGDREAARRDLSQALLLLQREDASRLLLFGGGFGREALLALCRAELSACGGSPS